MSTEEKALATAFTGENIAKMLRTTGPIVKCVLLKCAAEDAKISAAVKPTMETNDLSSDVIPRKVLEEWIEEIEVDTTPKKSQVQQILKGPFTFLGQYEDEGIMVIVRRNYDQPIDEDDTLNQHQLQPPLHNARVYGDILLMRVAHSNDDDGNGGDEDDVPETIMSNEEFFLDYTKSEYVAFAKRTDIVAMEPEEDDEEEENEEELSGEEEDDDDDDDEYEPNEDDEDDDELDEESKIGMMNMILSQILQRFKEDNGRGPDTEELLSIRSALAEKLGIDTNLVNPPDVVDAEKGMSASPRADKRPLDDDARPDSSKRVKFSSETEVKVMKDDEGSSENASLSHEEESVKVS
jgi:hypothetical protein